MAFLNETFSPESLATDLTQLLSDDATPFGQERLQTIAPPPKDLTQLAEALDIINWDQTADFLTAITNEEFLDSIHPTLRNGLVRRAEYLPEQTIDSSSGSLADSDWLTGLVGALIRNIDGSLDTLLNGGYATQEDAIAPEQADRAGNTLTTAHNLGVLSSNQTVQDFVGAADANDYYRFSLTQRSRLRLALTDLTANADIELLNRDGKVLEASYGEGLASEEMTQAVDAGDYYIRVSSAGGDSNYRLAVAANVLSVPDNAGNTFRTARNIGTLGSSSRSFQDFIGNGDANDFYRFSLSQNSNFSLELTGLSADADVQLFNSLGQLVGQSWAPGSSSESINRSLAAGTYYIRVFPYATANTNYRLTLNAAELTASPSSFSNVYGYGLVNAADAVARALGQATSLPDVANLGGNNWGLDLVNAPEAWARGYTGDGVVVAVIDSGVDINHADLRDNIWVNTDEIPNNGVDDDGNGYIDDINGWNFGVGQNNNNVLPGTNDPGQGHGTHVAGTIAAANNGIGVTGVAHESSIMAIRMGDVSGGRFLNAGNLAQAIRYAVDNGADVINMSLGWTDSPEIQAALAYAASNNVITVSASGNGDANGNGLPFPGNPARYATQYGISVGAVDINQDIARFSNRPGNNSDLQHVVAPGVRVYSTTPNNTYGFSSGTSMATPHVAGVVALMLDANPNLTHAQVRQILTDSSVRLA
ncbi:peptidase S8 [Leptolyngbyaceae cyanobacterium CCMR0082]|uniref:Peptidase S8 n=1 Tax=Adonisia turfae CCMR0082 TaxID=2304604 RepID=A0A6M0SAD8_9CYAN|nr:S8 family serine peptidase [Adonisia turfae]NEZ65410.1 peptidase S8 [Adonisia turfae CCMR0082]